LGRGAGVGGGERRDGGEVDGDAGTPGDRLLVRRVYLRREFENIWLRTKRYNASGKVVSGTGGVCYLYFPACPSPSQLKALDAVGVR
ncbi:peptidase C39 family protein, partial [Streptomyces sp. NPDC005921]